MVQQDTLGLINKPTATDAFSGIKSKKDACLSRGGTWDEASQTCKVEKQSDKDKAAGKARTTEEIAADMGISIEELKKQQDEFSSEIAAGKTNDPREFKAFRDEGTGELSGFERNGNTFLGAKPATVRQEAELQAQKKELVLGGEAEAANAAAGNRALFKQGREQAELVGQSPENKLKDQFTQQAVDYYAAMKSGVPGLFDDFITGGQFGVTTAVIAGSSGPQVALPEELVTAPVLGLTFGVVNAIRGYFSDYTANVKSQKQDILQTPIETLNSVKGVRSDLISAQNANPSDTKDNVESFNQQGQLVRDQFDKLKELTQDELAEYLGINGIDVLHEYEVYFYGGEYERENENMRSATLNPNPANVRIGRSTLNQLNSRVEKDINR